MCAMYVVVSILLFALTLFAFDSVAQSFASLGVMTLLTWNIIGIILFAWLFFTPVVEDGAREAVDAESKQACNNV